ncbi:unnamed protein product [Lampetra planeri]
MRSGAAAASSSVIRGSNESLESPAHGSESSLSGERCRKTSRGRRNGPPLSMREQPSAAARVKVLPLGDFGK